MEIPTEAWHEEVLDQTDLEMLEDEFSECSDFITEFTECFCEGGPVPGQTPENTAYIIGEWAYSNLSEQNYFVEVIDENVEGREGEKLAKAYIGVKAMKSSDL